MKNFVTSDMSANDVRHLCMTMSLGKKSFFEMWFIEFMWKGKIEDEK